MNVSLKQSSLLLFVPGNRPDRFAKAINCGADAVIVDLEDAVAPDAKGAAREGLCAARSEVLWPIPLIVRVNAATTTWHKRDMAAIAGLGITKIMLPKAETSAEICAVRDQLGPGSEVIALVETARGLEAAEELARAADRLAFGSIDFAVDMGCAHLHRVLLPARSRIVLATRLCGAAAPLDGVTLDVKDGAAVEGDARHARDLGFGGKLLIHPEQVKPARRGLAPSSSDLARARRIVAHANEDGSAQSLDGQMVDAPVLAWAHRIIGEGERTSDD